MLGRKGEGNIASPRMKRFDIITESDARVLDYGSTVVLAPGGRVTPLAADTLRSRRITVVRDAADVDAVSLAPPTAVKVVAIGGDHSSLALKAALFGKLSAATVGDGGTIVINGDATSTSTGQAITITVTPTYSTATGSITWSCVGSPSKYMPANCR